MTFIEFFIITRKRLLIAAILSFLVGAGVSFFMPQPDTRLKLRNNADRNAFISAKRDIDRVDGVFVAAFAVPSDADLNIKMAQRGHLALLDESEAEKLFGYEELERILVTRTVGVPAAAMPSTRHVLI